MPAAPEWMFISILALILFGPKKLPEVAKGVGKFIAELQKAKEEFRREILNIPTLPTIREPQEKMLYQPRLSHPLNNTLTTSPIIESYPLTSMEKTETPPFAEALDSSKEKFLNKKPDELNE